MVRTTLCASLALGLAGLLATPAAADIVHLKNGGKLEGKAETRDGKVILHTLFGTATIDAAKVKRIEKKKHLLDDYAAKAKRVKDDDVAGQWELVQWCKKHHWDRQARVHAQKIVDVEPQNFQARKVLDHVMIEGRWLPRAEALRAQGLVQYRGKWMSEKEAEKAHAADLAKFKRVRVQALVNHIVTTMSRADAPGRKLCYEELCRLAEENDIPGLKDSAKKVYDHYQRVAASRASAGSGVIMTELRLTNAQLVRPIPQLTTNLGQAGSTPVTIQLPELQIQGVQTTVAIPFGLPK